MTEQPAGGRGWRMPAEWDPHEGCLMAWPTSTRRDTLWHGHLDAARAAWLEVIRAVATFEPVLLACEPGSAPGARRLLGTTDHPVELFEVPLDDSWTRDNGPIVVVDERGDRRALDFRFNAWGGKFDPFDADDALPSRVAERLGLERVEVDLVLEGGSIAVDGAGTLVTTERCLLHPNRNPALGRAAIEDRLAIALGVDRVVWLPDGLADDDGTDGHVDDVVAFTAPGRVVLQGCDDPSDADHVGAAENRRRLEAAGLEVVELAVQPHVECLGVVVEVPYANLYVANGGVVVPTTGHAYDREALSLVQSCFPDREVLGVPGEVLAYGGGGVHCITQQIPAGSGG